MKDCSCEYWEENIEELNKPMGLWIAHGGKDYRGKVFEYCPWCGQRLPPEKKKKGDK